MSNTSNNQVEKFDPAKLMEGVKDRIKASFVSLIPDDQWENMIQREIDDFFKVRDNTYSGYRNETYSYFGKIVQSELETEAKTRMIELLNSENFQEIWDKNGNPAINKAIEKMIIENSGEILTNMFGGMFMQMLQNYKQNLMTNNF